MIKKIEIRWFRCIEQLDIDVKKINMFVGYNGAGKSSTLAAIRFALTGKAKKDDIKNGHNKCGIRVIFDDNTFFTRYITESGISADCNGKKTTLKSLNEYIEMKLGMKMTDIEMMLGEEYYTDINMASLLMSLIPVRIEKTSFYKIAADIKGDILTPNEIFMIDRYFGDIITSDDLTKAENTAKTERTVYNRDIRNLESMLKKADVQQPEKAKEDLEKLLAELSNADIYNIKLQEYENSLKAHNDAQQKCNAKSVELDKFKDLEAYNPDTVKDMEYRVSELEKKISELDRATASISANNDLIIKTLDALNKSVCPISNKLICNTDKTPLYVELEFQKNENEEVISKYNIKSSEYREQVKSLKKSISMQRELENQWKKREIIEKELKILEGSIPAKKDKPNPPNLPNISRDDILQQIQAWDKVKENEIHKAELHKLKRKVEMLNYILDLLKPENAKSHIIKRIVEPIEMIINEKAAEIGKKIHITTGTDGIEILLETKTGDVRISKCSSGEFVDIVYLIMTTISSINKSSILMLDNLDKLDDDAFHKLYKALENDNRFTHIFIAGIHADDNMNGITWLDK